MSYHNPNRSRTGNHQTSLEVCLAIQPLNYVSRIFLTSYYCMVFGFSTQNRLTFYSFEKVLFLLPLAPFEKDYKTSTLGLVPRVGLEPTTYRFSVCCVYQFHHLGVWHTRKDSNLDRRFWRPQSYR